MCKESLQKKYHDNRAKLRTFTPGQTVMARDYTYRRRNGFQEWLKPAPVQPCTKLRFTTGRLLLGILTNSYQPIPKMINCHQMIGLHSSMMKLPTPLLLPKTSKMKYLHPDTNLRRTHERRPIDRLQAKRGGMWCLEHSCDITWIDYNYQVLIVNCV